MKVKKDVVRTIKLPHKNVIKAAFCFRSTETLCTHDAFECRSNAGSSECYYRFPSKRCATSAFKKKQKINPAYSSQ